MLEPASPEPSSLRAYVDFAMGNYDLAVHDLSQAIARKRRDSSFFQRRGYVEAVKGDLPFALEDYRQASKLDPANMQLAQDQAGLYLRMKNYSMALKMYDAALATAPDNISLREARAFALLASGQERDALAAFQAVVTLNPQFAEPLNQIALILATNDDQKIRDPRAALQTARKSCDLTQWQDPDGLDALAAAYAANGNLGEASKWQNVALQNRLDRLKTVIAYEQRQATAFASGVLAGASRQTTPRQNR
jgi:tetratricopeptide (TPR) repeat protein